MNRKCSMVLAAAAVCACAVGGENLLKNGNFAELDAKGKPVGWNDYDTGAWRVAKGEGVGGANAMLFECHDGKPHSTPGQTLVLEPGKKYVYSVKVRHEGLKFADPAIRRNNGVQFCLIGLDAKGERTCGYFAHGSQGTRDWYELREYLMEVPIWTKSAKYSISVWMGLNGKAWFSDARVEEYVPPKVENLATSAYRDKAWTGKVRLAAALNLSADEAKSCKATFIYRNAQGAETRAPADSLDAETAFLTLDAKDFAKGAQTIRFELSGADGKSLGSAERPFARLDGRPKDYMVWHDEHGRWVVNGKPFFPFSVGVNKKDLNPEHLATVIDAGFNTIQVGGEPEADQWDYFLTNGLKAICKMSNLYYGERWTVSKGWKSYDDQVDFITNRVVRQRGRKALFGWYLNDETRPVVTPKMLKQQRLFEEIDPGHPTTSTWDHPEYIRGYIGCFDECDIDPYPIGRWPVSQVADWLIPLKAGATGVKPFGVTVQAMDWMWFRMGKAMATPHFPTFRELRCMSWQAIVGGAMSLKYYGFNHFKDNPERLKEYDRNYGLLKRVSTEVRRLIPVFLSAEEPVKVTVPEKSRLLTRAWRMGDESFVLVVNALGEGARAKLKLSERFGRGFLEMGEGVELEDGDTLDVVMEPLGCAMVHLTDAKRHLVFAGDSLLDAGGRKLGHGSWGEELRTALKDDVAVVNMARGGTSTRTFRAGDFWFEALAKTRPGDWVAISFGHNDSSPRTDRGVTVEDYRRNLARFAEEVRAKGAQPLFVTSVATCTFGKDGAYIDNRGLAAYVEAMKEVANEINAPVVDLYARTRADVVALGKDKAAAHYMISVNGKDGTHTTEAGAKRYAGFFIEEVKAALPALAAWLKP